MCGGGGGGRGGGLTSLGKLNINRIYMSLPFTPPLLESKLCLCERSLNLSKKIWNIFSFTRGPFPIYFVKEALSASTNF